MDLFAIRCLVAGRRGSMRYSPLSQLCNSKDVFGHVCSDAKDFERGLRDTPLFARLQGGAQESKSVILRGKGDEKVLAENSNRIPTRKRTRGKFADVLHHLRRTGPFMYILLA